MREIGHRRKVLLAGIVGIAIVTALVISWNNDRSSTETAGGSSTTEAPKEGQEGEGSTSSEPSTTTEPPGPKLAEFPRPKGEEVVVQPSGFVVTKLPEGEKPPQFIITSFDGVGWHEKWEYWRSLQEEVPFRFTGFLSGTYLLSDATKDRYVAPGHEPGDSSLAWTAPEDVPVEVADLNEALRRGDEIGTHFNGHFCSGVSYPVGDWTTADWNNEMDQFDGFIENVAENNGIDVTLDLKPSDIKGSRTPCLEGQPAQMYPAFKEHGLVYDSSPPKTGISWPVKMPEYDIWDIGMALFPMAGTDRPLITMDYNFYYRQRNASSAGVTPEQSKADSDQVVQTYRDMYGATFEGNRAPLILGNHFNEWNNNAYTDAVATFLRESCVKPDTYCVPFRDLVVWMESQDPQVIANLQALPAETDKVPNPPVGGAPASGTDLTTTTVAGG